MKKNLFFMIFFIFMIIMFGCDKNDESSIDENGNGESYSDEEIDIDFDEDQEFDIGISNSLEPGYKIGFSLSSEEGEISGKYSIITRDEIEENGQTLIPVDVLIYMENNNTGKYKSILSTTYYNENGDPVYGKYDEDVVASPIEIIRIEKAKIGDFGKTTSWSWSNGIISTGTWKLEPAQDDLANLVFVFTYKNKYENTERHEKHTLTIDEDGDTKYIVIDIESNGKTFNFYGKRVY